MTFTDPIGDMFSELEMVKWNLNSVEIPSSNFRRNILEILKKRVILGIILLKKLKIIKLV